jgi:hypothetical protein
VRDEIRPIPHALPRCGADITGSESCGASHAALPFRPLERPQVVDGVERVHASTCPVTGFSVLLHAAADPAHDERHGKVI